MTEDTALSRHVPDNPYGARWLQHPLVDVVEINRRQTMVHTLCSEKALMDNLQKGTGMLRGMPGATVIGKVYIFHYVSQVRRG